MSVNHSSASRFPGSHKVPGSSAGLRFGKKLADLAKSLKIMNILGKGRHRRDRNAGVSRGEPLSKVLLTRRNLLETAQSEFERQSLLSEQVAQVS